MAEGAIALARAVILGVDILSFDFLAPSEITLAHGSVSSLSSVVGVSNLSAEGLVAY